MAKCSCSHCDQNIEFDDSMIGNEVTCPSCGKNTKLLLSAEESVSTIKIKSTTPPALNITNKKQDLKDLKLQGATMINEADRWFSKALLKGTGFFAKALVGIGMFWFVFYFMDWWTKSRLAIRYPSATSETKELIIGNIFTQFQMGLIIAGIGILIIEVRKLLVSKERKSE